MVIKISLQNLSARIAAALSATLLLSLLLAVVSIEFIKGTLADDRYEPDYELLRTAVKTMPDSGRLLSRLAEAEAKRADFESAETHLLRAITLSPNNYSYRLILASIQEERGNLEEAEEALKAALGLAPNYLQVHWNLANLLIREGKVKESGDHFRFVVNAKPRNAPAVLDLLWNASKQDLGLLRTVTENNPQAELKLARFLVNQDLVNEAADSFSRVDKDFAASSIESSQFFEALIKKGYPKSAFELWSKTFAVSSEKGTPKNSWNGDFESEISENLSAVQFNWQLKTSDYARVSITDRTAHSGGKSLLLEFMGKETTRLGREIKQLVILDAGGSYQFECFVKTENLQTTEGPRIAVTDKTGKTVLASSEPIAAGTKDWTRLSFNFVAPVKADERGAASFLVSVKRQPRYAYDAPTKGRVWFDDFSIKEVKGK